MLKIRYNIKTKQLSGWADETEDLATRKGEAVAVLDIEKPGVDDYEYCYYRDNALVIVEPEPVRDLEAEVDTLKAKVEILEKK